MFPAKQFPVRTSHTFLLALIVTQVTLTQSVTVNPHQDNSETSTASSQRNWKSSFIRNNKEIKFIPSAKNGSKDNSDQSTVVDETPLSKVPEFGQRKQNLESSDSENLKSRRTNYLTSLKSRNNTKLNLNKESNKIDIILLPQDESEEVSTRPSSYRRRYRKKSRQQQREAEKQAEEKTKEDNSEKDGEKSEISPAKKVDHQSQNETADNASSNRLFSKNKRRLFGNRYGNKINKETAKISEKQNEEEKVDKTEKTEKENSYKIDLNEGKKEESKTTLNERNENHVEKSEHKSENKSSEEITKNSMNKEKEDEKADKHLQKYHHATTVTTLATPIEILSTHPTSNYFENNSYNKVNINTNGLSNMQLLHSLGMRKVRQPNHHKKRHQQESKSRSQYNINSDSQMYIVKLPPQPYYYLNDKSTYNLKPKNNLPIKMVGNGKIDKVYHYNLPLVEKLMTGRKTYSGNKVHKIHDPVQPYYGPYSHNEYDVMSKKPLTSNKKSDSDSFSGNSYHKVEATQEHKKVIPVHEDNMSVEDSDKLLDTRHDYTKFTPSAEFSKFNVKDDYKTFDPSDAYNKFDAQEHYKKFNEKAEYEKFNADDAYKKFNPADDYKSFDVKYDFEKFKPSSDSKFFDTDYKYKVTKPWNYHSKGSSYDSNIINIKPGQSFASSPFDGNSIGDKTYLGDKNFRNFDRVKSTSVSPIYMKPYVHRYYTNNGRPKSIYVLPQYHKT